MEQELKQLKAEKERLEASGQRSGHAGLVAPCSISGQLLPMGASSAEPRAPNKKKGK